MENDKDSSLVSQLKRYLDSEEFKEDLKKEKLYKKQQKMFKDRWFSKFNSLSYEKQQDIIDKIIEKYNSDYYIKREYKLGVFPRKDLFYMLLDYAKLYGIELVCDKPFIEEKYLFLNNYVIELLQGQGCDILCHKGINNELIIPIKDIKCIRTYVITNEDNGFELTLNYIDDLKKVMKQICDKKLSGYTLTVYNIDSSNNIGIFDYDYKIEFKSCINNNGTLNNPPMYFNELLNK